ncbi:MAG: tyrosine-type recombinase/integrase [Candidatus Limiplasma sp.]|nr:tyrosine-type recombinase/integrase [Candidatus Limiplasma sp.]
MLLMDAAKEFIFDCKVRKLSEATIYGYQKQIEYLVKYIETNYNIKTAEAVKSVHIKQFLLMMEERGRKPQYINDLLKVYKVFFKYCAQEEHIASNPTAKIHNTRQPKVLIRTFNQEDIRKMLNYFQGRSYINIRNRTMLAMFFDTGMRLSEVLTLRQEQIHDDYILVHGKGNKERLVPMSPYLAKLLMQYNVVRQSYFGVHKVPQNYVFVSYSGVMLTGEAVAQFMKKAAAEVGISKDVRVSPHTCRHTFAHLQLKNGLDLYSLSRLMGHENISITQRYLDGIRNDEVLAAAKQTGVLAHL